MADGDKRPWLEPYRWQKGQSGNPGGRPRRKPITDAYREFLQSTDDNGFTAAERIAQALILQAINGNVSAAKEISDRVEGTVRQALDVLFGGLTDEQLAEYLAAQYGTASIGDAGSPATGDEPGAGDSAAPGETGQPSAGENVVSADRESTDAV